MPKERHVATVCKSGQTNLNNEGKRPNARQRDRAQWIDCDANPEQDEDTDLPICRVSNPSSHLLTVELQVNNKDLLMEVDTGASVQLYP